MSYTSAAGKGNDGLVTLRRLLVLEKRALLEELFELGRLADEAGLERASRYINHHRTMLAKTA